MQYNDIEEELSPEQMVEIAEVANAAESSLEKTTPPTDKEIFQKYLNGGVSLEKVLDAMFKFCYEKNLFYDNKALERYLMPINDEKINSLPEHYLEILKDDKYAGLTFFNQIQRKNFEILSKEHIDILDLNEDDKKNRMQVMEILGYDPFADEDAADRPQLYRDLTGMLTEAMRKDVTKAKAALVVVRGYNNIDRYQRKINEIMRSGKTDAETEEQLDSLFRLQKTMQDSINQTAEKNNFSVKGIGSNGKGMISDVINQIEDYGVDEGVTNYYDIATSKSIEEIANISFKAQMNQINLSKTDYVDILTHQREIVEDCQRKAKDAMEALRIAREKLTKQELLEELEKDLRKKGISESEIESFIEKEYTIYDGKD